VKDFGISRQGVDGIAKELRERGTQQLIHEARLQIDGSKKIAKRQNPGRPGIESLRQFLDGQDYRNEPVIALVSLVLCVDLQIAVFAVRGERTRATRIPRDDSKHLPSEPPRTRRLLNLLEKSFTKTPLDAEAKVPWTDCDRDQLIKNDFFRLRGALRRISDNPEAMWTGSLNVPSLSDRFRPDWSFFVVGAGHPTSVKSVAARFQERASHLVVGAGTPTTFLDQLEWALYRLRIKNNIRGLLFSGCRADGGIRNSESDSAIFQWHINEEMVTHILKIQLLRFWIFGLIGMCFELPPGLSKAIPYKQRISMDRILIRPKITVARDRKNPDQSTVRFALLPEIVFPLKKLPNAEANSLAKTIRGLLRSQYKKLAAYEYAVRPTSGRGFRLPVLDQLAQIDSSNSILENSSTALALVPRHFFTSEPPLSLPDMQSLAMTQCPNGGIKRVSGKLIFNCPRLIVLIEEAYRANRYASQVEARRKWNGIIRRVIGDSDYEPWTWFDDLLPFWPGQQPYEYADDTATENLKQTYWNYDADFLLREISNEGWKLLLTEAESWGYEYKTIIGEKGRDFPRIIASLPRDLRQTASNRQDDLKDWWADALLRFNHDSTRIFRNAVENAQRYVLAEQAPLAIVVRTEEELVRVWEDYLGKYLRGRLLDRPNEFASRSPDDEHSPDYESDPWNEMD